MSTIEAALRTYLETVSDVFSVFSDRMYPSVAPEGTDSPFLVYTVVSTNFMHNLDGFANQYESLMQVDIYSDSTAQSSGLITILDASQNVIDALHEFEGDRTGVKVLNCRAVDKETSYDDEAHVYRIMTEFEIMYRYI